MSAPQVVEQSPGGQCEQSAAIDCADGQSPRGPETARLSGPLGHYVMEAVRRTGTGAAVAALVAPLLGLLEGYWVVARSSEAVPRFPAWLAAVGLLAVPGLILGAGVGGATWWLHPAHSPSVRRLRAALREGSWEARRWRAVVALLGPVLAVIAVAFTAQAALGLLVLEGSAGGIGMLMAGAAVSIFGGLGLVGLLVAHRTARRFGEWHPDPVRWGAVGLAAATLILAVLIAQGTTSGAGGSWALFGVFKRQELDLRLPAQLLLWCGAVYLGGSVSARIPRTALVLVVVAVLGCTGITAVSTLEDARVGLALERSGALGRVALAGARRITDRDQDGFSRWFGGGDCNEGDPSIGPSADDLPGNGIDEDCSGKDAAPVAFKREKALDVTPEGWITEKVPAALRLVLITVDTLRHDIGFTGYPRPITPNIDRLAAKSSVFTRAYSLASYTGKSVGPMLIGKYPSETHRGWSHFNEFRGPDVMVAERLQKAGIRTVSVQGHWYFFQKRFGLQRGYDVVDSSAAPKQPQLEGDRSSTSRGIADATIAQLAAAENAQGKLFVWAHFTDPHSDYVPHEGFDFGRAARDLYDSEVAFVDQQVGRILDAVENGPDRDRTVVIVASDHGEAFGEHGMWRHGFELWEPLVRVPWIVHVPGLAPRTIPERRSLIDLVPTILDFYRLPSALEDLSGQSVLLDILGPPGHTPKPKIVFIDMSEGPHNAERQAFIENDMKLIASSARPLGLYDLKSDPGEEQNLLKDKSVSDGVVERFKAFRRELKWVRVQPTP